MGFGAIGLATHSLYESINPSEVQIGDIDYMLAMGELFAGIAYGHLILEKALMDNTDSDLLNQVFDVLVRDFAVYAADLHGKPGNSEAQRT